MPDTRISAAAARDLLLYMLWADRTTLRAVREVTPEHLRREAGVSFGSLFGTMVHMLGSQRRWLARFQGHAPANIPAPDDFPDLISWIHAWEETAAEIEAFLASLTDEQLAADLSWTDSEGGVLTRPLWQPVLHLVNHCSYHRGQIVSLLRQMGYSPPSTDLIRYFGER